MDRPDEASVPSTGTEASFLACRISSASFGFQCPEMLTHHALEMLKRRTGLTKVRCVKLIAPWYETACVVPALG
ncbi:MAG: hypothetical protein WCY11_16505 [Novosphingobium sp.]